MICRKIIWKRRSCEWWKHQTCYSFHFLGFLITDLTLKWPNSTAKLPTTTFKSHSTTRRTTTSCYTTTCAKPTAKSATTATWATKRCKRRWREKKKTRDWWTYDQGKCIVNLWCEKQDMLNFSRCNQVWSSIKTEVDKYGIECSSHVTYEF